MVSHASLICLVLALASAAEQNATTSLKIAPTPTLMVSAEVSAEIQAKSQVLATQMLALTKVFDGVPTQDESSIAALSRSHKKHTESVESFTCEVFAFTYADFCLGVVDYAFMVPAQELATSAEVVATMGMTAWYASGNMNRFVSSACRTDMKRYICAQIYLPCVDGVVSGDTSTYATTEKDPVGQPGVTVALPYVRPCASLCTAVSRAGQTCGGTIEALSGTEFDCTMTDAAGTAVFDTGATCNNLVSTIGQPLVAEATEWYIGTYCAGIIDGFISVGDVGVNMLPYYYQTIQEATASITQSYWPVLTTKDCLNLRRMYMCSTSFLEAGPWVQLGSSEQPSIYGPYAYTTAPAYPERSLCTKYSDACGAFLSHNAELWGYPVVCDRETFPGSGVHVFPEQEQTVYVVSGQELRTEPNDVLNKTTVSLDALEPSCPYMYTITHEHPQNIKDGGEYLYYSLKQDPNAELVSLCAYTCVFPMVNEAHREKAYYVFMFRFFYVGIVSAIVLFNTLSSPPKKRNWYMSSLTTLYLANFVVTACFLAAKPTGDWNCASENLWYTWAIRDYSPIAAFAAYYTIWAQLYLAAFYTAMLIASLEICMKICMGIKSLTPYRPYVWGSVIGYTVFWLLMTFFYKDEWTTPKSFNQPFIFGNHPFALEFGWILDNSNNDWVGFWFRISLYIIYAGISALCLLWVVYTVVKISLKAETGTMWESFCRIWSQYSLILMLLPMTLFANIPWIAFWLYYNEIIDRFTVALIEWYSCIVDDFFYTMDRQHGIDTCGSNLEDWRGINGEGPYTSSHVGSWGVGSPLEWCAIVTATCILVISFNSHVSALWWDKVVRGMEMLGLTWVLRQIFTSEAAKVKLQSMTKKRQQVSMLSSTAASSAVSSAMSNGVSEMDADRDADAEGDIEGGELAELKSSPKPGAAMVVATLVDSYTVGAAKNIMASSAAKYAAASEDGPTQNNSDDEGGDSPKR